VSVLGCLESADRATGAKHFRVLAFAAIVCLLFPKTAPAASGQWASIGPELATVSSLAVHPANPDLLLAGAERRVFKSINGGTTWFDDSSGLPMDGTTAGPVTVLKIDPTNPKTLYAGSRFQGLFKSVDGGRSWARIESTQIGGPEVYDLAISPFDPQTVFVATLNGLYRSSNGAMDWVVVHAGPGAEGRSVELDPTNPSRLYTGTDSQGILRSLDGGSTWFPINEGLPQGSDGGVVLPILRLTHHPTVSGVLYAYTESGFYKTVDGGDNWFFISSVPAEPGIPRSVNALEADSANNVYLATGGGVYRSADGGREWDPIGSEIAGAVTSLALDPVHPGTIYVGTRSSVFKTTDAGFHWVGPTSGLSNLVVFDLALEPNSTNTLYAASAGLYKWNQDAGSWRLVEAGQAFSVAVDQREPSHIYAAGLAFHVSEDRGETWTRIVPVPFGIVYTSVAVDPFDSDTLYLGTCCGLRGLSLGVLKSRDRGRTWTEKSVGLTPVSRRIQDLVLDPRIPGLVYAGTAGGVFKSTDGGETWKASELRDWVNVLAVAPSSAGSLYAGTIRGLFRSDDGGETWRSADTGLPDRWVLSIATPSAEKVYVGTRSAGVFESQDRGNSWQPFGGHLRDRCVSALLTDSRGRVAYAGTCSASVFRREMRSSSLVVFR
jgi:photosystem II stability/assembly factor-like uncharacterized protein